MSALFRAVALKQAQKHGFGASCMKAAAAELNLSPAAEGALTPTQLAMEVCKLTNMEALDYLAGDYEPNMPWLPKEHIHGGFKHNVAAGLLAKFDALAPYHHDWETALTEMATTPDTYCEQVKLVGQFVDDLCYAAGDGSHDLSYYRRRASLFTLYSSTMLVFVQDTSPELKQTFRYIESNTPKAIW